MHIFGDSMVWLVNNKTGLQKPVSAYLKTIFFWNMTDRSRVGAKVAGIIEQIRDFFLVWKPSDITDTVVPAGGSHIPYTNIVPSLVLPSDPKYGEYHAPTRELIHQQGGPEQMAEPARCSCTLTLHSSSSHITTFVTRGPATARR